jgi:predicted dehydrogenase
MSYFSGAVAVAGTGFIGPVHVEALRRVGIPVKGILASSPEKSQTVAAALGLAVGYPDFASILSDIDIRAVHLTTPNKFHYEMARMALLAGKHVICEKPLALTSQQTADLVALAATNPHLAAAVNYNLRYYPIIQHVRELVQSGALGQIRHIRGAYVQDWLLYETDFNWRVLAAEGGALRTIGDIGTHWMDLIYYITGLRITSLLADLKTFLPVRKRPKQAIATFETNADAEYIDQPIDTEDYGAVLFQYENGGRGSMEVSQVSAGRKNQLSFEIAGSLGSVAWDGENPNQLWLGHRNKPNEVLIKDPGLLNESGRRFASYPGGHAEGFPDTFKQLYQAVYGYIAAGNFTAPKPFPTFADGHYELALCEAILASHQTRRWVDLG